MIYDTAQVIYEKGGDAFGREWLEIMGQQRLLISESYEKTFYEEVGMFHRGSALLQVLGDRDRSVVPLKYWDRATFLQDCVEAEGDREWEDAQEEAGN